MTLGTFDGVHLGHQSILSKLKKATQHGLYESVVLTFFPHPRIVLQEGTEMKQLNTLNEKFKVNPEYPLSRPPQRRSSSCAPQGARQPPLPRRAASPDRQSGAERQGAIQRQGGWAILASSCRRSP